MTSHDVPRRPLRVDGTKLIVSTVGDLGEIKDAVLDFSLPMSVTPDSHHPATFSDLKLGDEVFMVVTSRSTLYIMSAESGDSGGLDIEDSKFFLQVLNSVDPVRTIHEKA